MALDGIGEREVFSEEELLAALEHLGIGDKNSENKELVNLEDVAPELQFQFS